MRGVANTVSADKHLGDEVMRLKDRPRDVMEVAIAVVEGGGTAARPSSRRAGTSNGARVTSLLSHCGPRCPLGLTLRQAE